MEEIGLLDIIVLTEKIKCRKAEEYIIQAQIAAYPQMEEKDRKTFINELSKIADFEESEEEIDQAAAIDLIKSVMSKSRGVQVK